MNIAAIVSIAAVADINDAAVVGNAAVAFINDASVAVIKLLQFNCQ